MASRRCSYGIKITSFLAMLHSLIHPAAMLPLSSSSQHQSVLDLRRLVSVTGLACQVMASSLMTRLSRWWPMALLHCVHKVPATRYTEPHEEHEHEQEDKTQLTDDNIMSSSCMPMIPHASHITLSHTSCSLTPKATCPISW